MNPCALTCVASHEPANAAAVGGSLLGGAADAGDANAPTSSASDRIVNSLRMQSSLWSSEGISTAGGSDPPRRLSPARLSHERPFLESCLSCTTSQATWLIPTGDLLVGLHSCGTAPGSHRTSLHQRYAAEASRPLVSRTWSVLDALDGGDAG